MPNGTVSHYELLASPDLIIRFILLMLSIAYLDLKLPPGAPVILKPSPGKGWGLFATKDVQKDSLIMTEEAVLTGPADMNMDGKSVAHILAVGSLVDRQYNDLPASSKQQLDCLRIGWQEGYEAFSEENKHLFNMLHRHSTKEFKDTSCNATTDLLTRNMFIIGAKGRVIGQGLYPIHSRMNHSCVPNVNVEFWDMGIKRESYARCDIKAGSELTFTYSGRYEVMTSQERREALGFVCDCKACQPGTTFNQLSDVRRIYMRGLEYLLNGCDWDNKIQTENPIIIDSALKKRAESLDLPLTSRMIYTLLLLWLMQEEGFGDRRSMRHHVENLCRGLSAFATDRNLEILDEGGMPDTDPDDFFKLFCIASKLWGRSDLNDAYVTHRTRVLRIEAHGI